MKRDCTNCSKLTHNECFADDCVMCGYKYWEPSQEYKDKVVENPWKSKDGWDNWIKAVRCDLKIKQKEYQCCDCLYFDDIYDKTGKIHQLSVCSHLDNFKGRVCRTSPCNFACDRFEVEL